VAETEEFQFAGSDVLPDRLSVYQFMGICPGERTQRAQAQRAQARRAQTLQPRIEKSVDEAYRIFRDLARPTGKLREIPREHFKGIYQGEGLNDPQTPVNDIAANAASLALFAATLGTEVSEKITALFGQNELPLGYALDAVCSAGAELTADRLETGYLEQVLLKEISLYGEKASSPCVMRYSPGFCGWHLSGQRKLFESLQPETIGITLNESFLMSPMKSVSGVIISGKNSIFLIDSIYSACSRCRHRSCDTRSGSRHNSQV